MNIKKDIQDNRVILIIVPGMKYAEAIIDIANQATKIGNVCYVSLNKTSKALKTKLDLKKPTQKFGIIDCISKSMVSMKDAETDCVYVSSPNALTEISIAVTKDSGENKIVIIDSLSTLRVYHKDQTASRFVRSVIEKIRSDGKKAILTILDKDRDSFLGSSTEMVVDSVLEYKA